MDLNTFIKLYEEFLYECEQKGWTVQIIKQEIENHLASIKHSNGMEVQIHIEIDLNDYVQIGDKTNQGMMNFGFLSPEGDGDMFLKEVREAYNKFMEQHAPKPN